MNTSLLRSKRYIAACIAMVLMMVVSYPALEFDPEVASELRKSFLYLALAYIGGQTANDVMTRGKTSANPPASEEI